MGKIQSKMSVLAEWTQQRILIQDVLTNNRDIYDRNDWEMTHNIFRINGLDFS